MASVAPRNEIFVNIMDNVVPFGGLTERGKSPTVYTLSIDIVAFSRSFALLRASSWGILAAYLQFSGLHAEDRYKHKISSHLIETRGFS